MSSESNEIALNLKIATQQCHVASSISILKHREIESIGGGNRVLQKAFLVDFRAYGFEK